MMIGAFFVLSFSQLLMQGFVCVNPSGAPSDVFHRFVCLVDRFIRFLLQEPKTQFTSQSMVMGKQSNQTKHIHFTSFKQQPIHTNMHKTHQQQHEQSTHTLSREHSIQFSFAALFQTPNLLVARCRISSVSSRYSSSKGICLITFLTNAIYNL